MLLLSGFRGSFPGLKWPKREVDHPPLLSDDVRNEWIYTSAPPICLHGTNRDHYAWIYNSQPLVSCPEPFEFTEHIYALFPHL